MIFIQNFLSNGSVTDTTTLRQSEPGSNGQEYDHYIPQISCAEASTSDEV